jgi:PBP1b-binding outer membrane lipoprotein LpoB
MKTMLMIAGLALCFSGCASNSGVVATGDNTFLITKQAATGLSGMGNLKVEVIEQASIYCQNAGKHLSIDRSEETRPPYILGNYPREEMYFHCK